MRESLRVLIKKNVFNLNFIQFTKETENTIERMEFYAAIQCVVN